MKVGIIGGGFTGLAAAYYLQKKGHEITLIEKDKEPGGLAVGYQEKKWKWSLEKHYHHFFTNDKDILRLSKEIGHKIVTKRPKTSVFVDGEILQLDSPLKVLTFKKLSLLENIRMAASLGLLRYNPFWKILENYKTTSVLPKIMGERAYKMIWEPQMEGKFGKDSHIVSLAWFWARVKKRTTKLSYPEKGFLSLAKHLSTIIEKGGAKVLFDTNVLDVKSTNQVKIRIEKEKKKKDLYFDKVIVTLPSPLFLKIVRDAPISFLKNLRKRKNLGAINLILRLNKKFLTDGTYWLSICDTNFPFMAVVEQTNFINKNNYNNEYLIYVGKYLDHTHEYFSKSSAELLKIYHPYLKKLNPEYEKSLIDASIFKAPFAQPVIPVNYSKNIPSFSTPIKNVFLANIEQVYPWDRGTNYAVQLGRKIADFIT